MPKFKVGDKAVLPRDKTFLTQEFSGRPGTVTEVNADLQVQNRPGDRWVTTYMVQFEGEDDPMLAEEDWLEYS